MSIQSLGPIHTLPDEILAHCLSFVKKLNPCHFVARGWLSLLETVPLLRRKLDFEWAKGEASQIGSPKQRFQAFFQIIELEASFDRAHASESLKEVKAELLTLDEKELKEELLAQMVKIEAPFDREEAIVSVESLEDRYFRALGHLGLGNLAEAKRMEPEVNGPEHDQLVLRMIEIESQIDPDVATDTARLLRDPLQLPRSHFLIFQGKLKRDRESAIEYLEDKEPLLKSIGLRELAILEASVDLEIAKTIASTITNKACRSKAFLEIVKREVEIDLAKAQESFKEITEPLDLAEAWFALAQKEPLHLPKVKELAFALLPSEMVPLIIRVIRFEKSLASGQAQETIEATRTLLEDDQSLLILLQVEENLSAAKKSLALLSNPTKRKEALLLCLNASVFRRNV